MSGALQNACTDSLLQVRGVGGRRRGTYSKSKMPCNKEDGITEVECAVQVVVVQNNCGGEDNPNGDYSGGRDLWPLSWNLGGNGGW